MRSVVLPEKHRGRTFAPAIFEGNHRTKKKVIDVSFLAFDFDELPPCEPGDVLLGLRPIYVAASKYSSIILTTHSSTLDRPRGRLFVQLSRPITSDEYETLAQFMMGLFEANGLPPDEQCKDASRQWYAPSRPTPESPYRCITTNSSRPINVDLALANARAQSQVEERWPIVSGHVGTDAFERCRKYVGTMAPAVSGAGGHNATYRVACKIVQHFGLRGAEAWAILAEYNLRCDPPWTERELHHKLESAMRRRAA